MSSSVPQTAIIPVRMPQEISLVAGDKEQRAVRKKVAVKP